MQASGARPECGGRAVGLVYSAPRSPSQKVKGAYCAPLSKRSTDSCYLISRGCSYNSFTISKCSYDVMKSVLNKSEPAFLSQPRGLKFFCINSFFRDFLFNKCVFCTGYLFNVFFKKGAGFCLPPLPRYLIGSHGRAKLTVGWCSSTFF